MRNGVAPLILAALLIAAGCAAPRNAAKAPAPQAPPPAPGGEAHDPDDPAYLTLDEIRPAPKLPDARPPSTAGPAPLDALVAYAKARDATARGDRAAATTLLERAAALDPDSPEVFEELGRAYGAADKAMGAYETALALDPDNLALHERVGRQYLIKNRVDEALEHFRLATQTTEYSDDNEAAAVLDYFLATALRRKGFDRAALDQYAKLAKRLDGPAASSRSNPELLSLLGQPELLYGQIGELYEKHKEYADAIRAYELAAEHAPDNFEAQARLARAMVAGGRAADGEARAQALVTRFRASPDSLALLRDVYRAAGHEGQLVDAVAALRKAKPADRSLLFALADALKQGGRAADAENLLIEASKATPDDAEIVRRIFALYEERDDAEGAVRLLVNALAARPDSIRQLTPLWSDLLKPSRRNRVRPGTVQKLKVDPPAEAARLFWLSRVADLWNRDAIARAALEQAVAIKPAFPPAFRSLIADLWSRPDWDDAQKAAESARLVTGVRLQGNPALAAELEGLSLLRQKGRADAAAERLAESIKLGNKAPDVQLTQAVALRLSGNATRSEQLLWKIISDTPGYEEAYLELFEFYFVQDQANKAVNVLAKWLAADPGNFRARGLRARIMHQAGRNDAAETELLSLFHDQPESAEVLGVMRDFYTDVSRLDEFLGRLEDERKIHPDNREAVEQLVLIYHEQKRLPEALRVLDAARAAVAGDPELLYYVAHLYGRIDQKDSEEKLLEEVVRLDPRNAPASNDLGYGYADAGKDLARAEDLIRVAVDAEPDNQSFLDSLGWVLYKRAKFADALIYFERAIGPATRPDPVVLDHMGDVHYRLSQNDQAVRQWKRAQQRLDQILSDRDDLKKLRLQLLQKLRQQERGQPVDVAPTAEGAAAASQVKQ